MSPLAPTPPPRRFALVAALGLAALALAACFNIYVQFPTAQLSELAADYTRRAWGTEPAGPVPDGADAGVEKPERGDAEPGGDDGGGESGFLPRLLPVVHAAEGGDIDVKIDTPAIRAIQEKQTARLKKLRPHFEAGRIGIGADGDLVVRNEDGIDLKARKEMREQVEAENASRAELYAEIARANKIDPGRVGEIRKIWAAAWIEEAPPGYWVQVGDKWQKKPPKTPKK